MRILLALSAASVLLLGGTAIADQKDHARKALGSGKAFQPSGYEVDGPTYYVNEGGRIRHVRDPRQPSKYFWHDQDRNSGGGNETAPASE